MGSEAGAGPTNDVLAKSMTQSVGRVRDDRETLQSGASGRHTTGRSGATDAPTGGEVTHLPLP